MKRLITLILLLAVISVATEHPINETTQLNFTTELNETQNTIQTNNTQTENIPIQNETNTEQIITENNTQQIQEPIPELEQTIEENNTEKIQENSSEQTQEQTTQEELIQEENQTIETQQEQQETIIIQETEINITNNTEEKNQQETTQQEIEIDISQLKDTTSVEAKVLNSTGNVVDAVMLLIDNETDEELSLTVQTQESQPLQITEPTIDAVMAFFEGPVEDIVFDDIKINNTDALSLRIDKLDEVNGLDIDVVQAYAIDPTSMNFTEAIVTVTAKGTDLYKCKQWNFEDQACYGSWILLKDNLIPGQTYEFTLTPDDPGFAEGIRTTLRAYATSGADPTVTAVVTDGAGIGIAGVTVNFTASAGVMTPTSAVTGVDGTASSTQTGGALSDTITLSSEGLSNVTVTTATAVALASTSRGIIWLDNRTQKVMTAVITPTTNVLVSTAVTPTYTAVSGGTAINPATISMGNTVTQTTPTIASGQIWHNTYQVADSITVEIGTTSPSPDFILTLPIRPEYNLFAYATGGANPTVTAVVMDKNNTAVANATVNFTTSAGAMSTTTGNTGITGTITSTQTGGALGDTINVTANVSGYALQPVQIVTAAAPAIAASSRVIAWREPNSFTINVATVSTVSTSLNVLTATATVTATNLDRTPFNLATLSTGSYTNQAEPQIGSIRLAPGTFGTDDVVQVTVGTTTPANDQAIILQFENRTYLQTYATAGANPTVAAVVIDGYGIPVQNVTVNFTTSAGAMTPTSAVTGVDGTAKSTQSGGTLGDTINVTMDDQLEQTTTSNSAGIAAADMVFSWYDALNRTLHTAAVTRATRVLTNASAVTVTAIDDTPTNQGTIAITTTLAQTNMTESITRVAQGTTSANDVLSIAVGTTTPTVDAFIRTPTDKDQYLYAFANTGANPTVTAIVTDKFGNGMSGINVTFTASAGAMTPTSALTGADGIAQSTQSGGALSDTINVGVANLNNITITTATSVAVAAADYIYAWYELNGEIARVATTTRATKVLTSTGTTSIVPTDNTPTNDQIVTIGTITQQTSTDPAFATISNRGSGDTLTIGVSTTTPATDAILILNDTIETLTELNTTLAAYATGGANPTVTAVVIDAYGHGIPNILVNFSASVGTMTPTSALTGPDGTVNSTQTGGGLGNTITISSENLSSTTITTAASVAIAATSQTITWLDPDEVIVKVAVVSTNNVLNSGTITPTFTLFDTNPQNQVTFSVGSTISQTTPTIASAPIWRRTFGAGGMIFVETPTTTQSPDGRIIMKNDTRNQLFAYATSGADPTITAVVTDNKGVGVQGVQVNFSTTAGTLNATSATTGPDGTATVTQTGGAIGDTISITNGEQNATIITAVSAAVAASARTIVWLDNSTNKIMAAVVSTLAASMNVLSSTGTVTVTNTDRTPMNNVTLSSGSISSQTLNTPGMARVAQGTYGELDIVTINVATTTPAQDGRVVLSINNRTFLNAFAISGANPTVTAYVHDYYGRPVPGITVNFTTTAGAMTPTSALTGADGIAQSTQSGGALSDTINVTILDLEPVQITTATSAAIAAADKVIAIYDPRSRNIRIATVTNATNVLTTTSAVTATAFDATYNPGVLSLNTVVAQTATTPATLEVISVTEQENDMISIAVGTTTPATDAFITIPDTTGNYLFAYATTGANPIVTAVVTDQYGVGVAGIPISFTPSAGTMTPTTNTTNASGMAQSTQSGGALSDTIAVTNANLTTVTITTATSVAAVAADTVISWYDPEGAMIYTSAVTRATNVLTTTATTNYGLVDNTPNNNQTAQSTSTTAQTSTTPGFLELDTATIADGDFASIFTTTITPSLDGIIFINSSTAVPANITITKTAFPDPVPNGSTLTYTITLNNTGGKTAFNVTVGENYSNIVIFNNATPAPTTGNTTWVIGNITGYNSTTITITVNVSPTAVQGSTFNNTANVTWQDETSTNHTNNVTINTTIGQEPNLVVTKSDSPDPVFNGSNLVYTINITNIGSGIATNTTITDILPPQVTFVSSSPTNTSNNTWLIGNITSGNSTAINITVLVNTAPGTTITNTVNVTYLNSTNDTVSRTDTENTTVIGIPIPPTGGGGAGAGGGGAGGGGGGGGSKIGPPQNAFEKTLEQETINTTVEVTAIRGEEIRFPIRVTNTYEKTVLTDVTIEATGPLAKYISWIPDKISTITYASTQNFLVSIYSPDYKTAKEHDITFYIRGTLEAVGTEIKNGILVSTKFKKPILIAQKVHVTIKDLSDTQIKETQNIGEELLNKLKNKNLPNKQATEILAQLNVALYDNDGEKVNTLTNKLRELVELENQIADEIEQVRTTIQEARNKGLDTGEAENILTLAVAAFTEEDFERSLSLTKDAANITFIEIKGAFNLLNFLVRNWWILLVLSAILSFAGTTAYSTYTIRTSIKKLAQLDDRESTLYENMRQISEQAYSKKTISMATYHKAMSQFENNIEKIAKTRSILHLNRVELLSIEKAKESIEHEIAALNKELKTLQESYYLKRAVGTKKYIRRETDIQRRIAHLDIERELILTRGKQ